MRLSFQNNPICHAVTLSAVCLLLTACDMPEKPAGADVPAMTHLGDQMRAQGDDEGAAQIYARSLERNPKDERARKELAEIFDAHNEPASAEAVYGSGVKLDPTNADFLHGHGRALLKLGRTAEARDEYERALQLDPHDVKALNGVGIALDYMNQHEAAQNSYREAMDIDPQDLVTINNLAHSYTLSGGYQQAIKLLEPYARDKNATPALRQNLAEAYGLAGMDADAERMARMDLTPAQTAKNLAWYKAERVKLSLVPKFYADLGSFATEAMADARSDEVKEVIGGEMDGLIINTKPQVKTIGGTPSFTLHITGFATAAKLRNFCDRLRNKEMECKTVSAM